MWPGKRERHSRRIAAAFVLALSLLCGQRAEAGALDASLSAHYSTGNYDGTEAVDIVYVPLLLRYETGLWSFKAVLPWLRISGGSATVETPGGPITTKNGTASGIGDLLVEAERSFEPLADWAPWITPGLRLKLPTASESKGLGTGEFDETMDVEFAQIYGRWTPFVTVGFRVLGDSSGETYRDGFLASIGTMLRVYGPAEAGLFLDWRQAAVKGGQDSLELLPLARFEIGEHWTVDGYVSTGFTNAVPDVGAGLEILYRTAL